MQLFIKERRVDDQFTLSPPFQLQFTYFSLREDEGIVNYERRSLGQSPHLPCVALSSSPLLYLKGLRSNPCSAIDASGSMDWGSASTANARGRLGKLIMIHQILLRLQKTRQKRGPSVLAAWARPPMPTHLTAYAATAAPAYASASFFFYAIWMETLPLSGSFLLLLRKLFLRWTPLLSCPPKEDYFTMKAWDERIATQPFKIKRGDERSYAT